MKSDLARAAAAAVILLAAAGLTQWVSRSELTPPARPFSQFPMAVGDWQGLRSDLDQKVYNVLGVEDYILADFREPEGNRLNLYVGYYQSQKQGDIIHSPKNCLPGSGWQIMESDTQTVTFNDRPATVARLLIRKGDARQVVLYWFQSRGRIIASEYWQKIWLVTDAMTRRRTDGSFVRLISPVIQTPEATTARLKAFAETIKPLLDRHIPS